MQEIADLVTFTGEILNGKLHFLCSDMTLSHLLWSFYVFSVILATMAHLFFFNLFILGFYRLLVMWLVQIESWFGTGSQLDPSVRLLQFCDPASFRYCASN